VGELERNNVKTGQSVDFQLDAFPETKFHGTVKTVGGNNTRMFWEDDTSTKFEVSITLATTDPRMRPGLTAHLFINSDPQKNVLYVPRQALFLKDNKRMVYVRNGSGFDPHEVKIQAENESRAATSLWFRDAYAERRPGRSPSAGPRRRTAGTRPGWPRSSRSR